MNVEIPQHGSAARRAVYCVVFALLYIATPQLHAAPTPVALVATQPQAQEIADCVANRLRERGPVVDVAGLVEGLEFRLTLQRPVTTRTTLSVTGFLKPSAVALAFSHDDDPEAHPQVVARMYEMLRIHVGTRAWLWSASRNDDACGKAFRWIDELRARPIVVDRIGPDGEPQNSVTAQSPDPVK